MDNVKQLVIIGDGETGMLAYEYFTNDSEYQVVSFCVEREFLTKDKLYELPVIALEDLEDLYPTQKYEVFVAVSSGALNRNRKALYEKVKQIGYTCASYISSRAFVWNNAEIGENCFVLEHNTVQPFVKVGNNVTLWSGNHIGHRSIIENHCFISSHCVISGFCKIGTGSFLGVNCTVENNVSIASDNFIGAGALIQKDTDPKSLYQCSQTELSKVNTHRLFRIKE